MIYACVVLSRLFICHTFVEVNGVSIRVSTTPFKSSEVLYVCFCLCLCPFILVVLTTNGLFLSLLWFQFILLYAWNSDYSMILIYFPSWKAWWKNFYFWGEMCQGVTDTFISFKVNPCQRWIICSPLRILLLCIV